MGTIRPVTMEYAAKLETSAALVYPAEVAIDCMALFSRSVISWPSPTRESTLNMPNERMTLVMPTPSVQPVRAPM